jgi:MFS transporter, DHA1 family, inner membrane transport protein
MSRQSAALEEPSPSASTIATSAADHDTTRAVRERLLMLLALCFATFLVTGNGVAVSPFLIDMSRDLGTDLAAVANLVALSSITWGIASLLAGAASDRLGRKPLLLGGLCILVLSPLGVAWSETYFGVAAWRIIGGLGGGAYMGAVFATVADRFPATERGRALGWLSTGQSLSLVVGVPLITSAGGVLGWRGAFLAYGLAMVVAAGLVWFVVPRGGSQQRTTPLPFRAMVRLLNFPTVALMLCSITERLCYSGVVVFFPTYLQATYGVTLGPLALGLAIVASGNLGGNLIGGRLADFFRDRLLVFAVTSAITGLLGLPALLWHPAVAISVALGFVYTLVNAVGRLLLLTSLSEVSGEARGAVMGLNITGSSVGWLVATTVGGPLIINAGFEGLGFFTAAAGLGGALLAAGTWFFRPGARVSGR